MSVMPPRSFRVSVSQIAPDDSRQRDIRHRALLRFSQDQVTLQVRAEEGGKVLDTELRFRRFRGSRVMQWLLTSLFTQSGMLVSRRDMQWVDFDQSQPIMQITPCVPPDFHYAVRFEDRNDAEEASRCLDAFFRS